MKRKGNPSFSSIRNRDTTKATEARVAAADAFALEVGLFLHETLGEAPRDSMHGTAEWLNENNYLTRRGSAWTAKAVTRLFARLACIHELKRSRTVAAK